METGISDSKRSGLVSRILLAGSCLADSALTVPARRPRQNVNVICWQFSGRQLSQLTKLTGRPEYTETGMTGLAHKSYNQA